MNKLPFIAPLILCSILSGCATQKYTVDTVGYSSWKGDKMLIRRKAILLNTETGETWGLSYNKANTTNDGYAWEELPKNIVESSSPDN